MWVAGPEEGSAPGSTPARMTFVPRKLDLFASQSDASPSEPKEGAVLDALGAAGAQYLDEVADRANLSERDTLSALWRPASAGRASNDNLAPLPKFARNRHHQQARAPVERPQP